MTAPALRSVALLAGLALLSGCSGGSPGRDDGGMLMAAGPGRGHIVRPGPDANAAYSAGIDLKSKGDCKGAIVKLRPVAGFGPGYEDAQTNLGQCLLMTAENAGLSSEYLEGLTWLRRAADGGWPEAQAQLSQAHTFGPEAIRNGDEAAYWLALYDGNAGKSRVGFTPMNPQELAAIRSRISSAQKASGEKRAASWERKVWLPPGAQNGPGLTTRELDLSRSFGQARRP